MLDQEELKELLARCALSDQKAFESLYQKTAAYLNAVAFRIVGCSDVSNDVLQDAFVQIWTNAASYSSSKAKPLTWMCSIVRYRAIDKVRHEHSQQSRTHHAEELHRLEDTPEESLEDTVLRLSFNKKVDHCLDAMNEKFKKSVELAYIYGYSREELAETLDTKVNTVKSWLHRGSAKLKECLQSKEEKATDV